MKKSFRYAKLGLKNKIARTIWVFFWLFLFRPTPNLFHPWRAFLLIIFGAQLGRRVHVYPSAKVWAPWNLEMGDDSCISEYVDCYCVDKIQIGSSSTVSQYSFLCTASHDYSKASMPLVIAPISIGDKAWITSDVFIGPGVRIGNGAVVIARSSVFKNIPDWAIARGNPAIVEGKRRIDDAPN